MENTILVDETGLIQRLSAVCSCVWQ